MSEQWPGVVMKFIDAPMGCRFQYIPDSKKDPVWIKLGIDGAGLIAECDPKLMKTPNWTGQMIAAFAESEEQMRRVSIKVLG